MTWTPKPGERAMARYGRIAFLLAVGPTEAWVMLECSDGSDFVECGVELSDLTPPPEWNVIEAARGVDESHRVMLGAAPGDALASAALRHNKAHVALRAALARHDKVAK